MIMLLTLLSSSLLQYGVVLTILVICEIAGGIAAAAKKGDVSELGK